MTGGAMLDMDRDLLIGLVSKCVAGLVYGDCRTRGAGWAWEGLVLLTSPGMRRFGVLVGRCRVLGTGADGVRFGALTLSVEGVRCSCEIAL
jgi:hypothetical protein